MDIWNSKETHGDKNHYNYTQVIIRNYCFGTEPLWAYLTNWNSPQNTKESPLENRGRDFRGQNRVFWLVGHPRIRFAPFGCTSDSHDSRARFPQGSPNRRPACPCDQQFCALIYSLVLYTKYCWYSLSEGKWKFQRTYYANWINNPCSQ